MAGREEPYRHLPFFYSDLFDYGYEAVGAIDARLETVAEWKKDPYKEGVIYYLRAMSSGACCSGMFGKWSMSPDILVGKERLGDRDPATLLTAA